MSSMVRKTFLALAVTTALAGSVNAQDAREWDRARANLVAGQPGPMARAVARWEVLTSSQTLPFDDYAGFLLAYPGLPDEDRLRGYAEARLRDSFVAPGRLIAYFDRFPPLTNTARAQYALALQANARPEAAAVAREAWRSGEMSDVAEATLASQYGGRFTQEDQDARMNALLWERATDAAERQMRLVSAEKRNLFLARLFAARGEDYESNGMLVDASARNDPGFLFNRVRQLRKDGRTGEAVQLLAGHPPLAQLPFDQTAWVTELLTVARLTGPSDSVRIAKTIDQAFEPGADISTRAYRLRDDYTSLMWLGGTSALWNLRDPASAAPLFYRYGAAARTPQTRSKGFYWAGLAARQAGDGTAANRYLEQAAAYPDRFYGMLALDLLGREMPQFAGMPQVEPSEEERRAFYSRPIVEAVREVARGTPWRTGIRFYRELAAQAQSVSDHLLVAEFARSIGRRDLSVIVGEAAAEHGYEDFRSIAFPTLSNPPGTDWTMVHAITRQESQFAQNAISHAGARGLMQLMPGTAREEAGLQGRSYMQASLIDDADYNVRLGSGYFQRMLEYYNGSYPLAVGAYNAGPGNVNKWLRANGDPRTGSVDWIEWIERIPIYETKNYVQRVLENAVVYESMHPDKASYRGQRKLRQYLR